MNKIWGAVALVGCMVLGSGALGWAEDNDDPQREAAGLTIAEARTLFHACQKTAAKTPSPLRKTPGTKMWCAEVSCWGQLGSVGTAWMRMIRWRKGPSPAQASVQHPNR